MDKPQASSGWGDRRKGGRQKEDGDDAREGSGKEHKFEHKKDGDLEFRRGNKSPSASKRNAASHQRGGSRLQGYGPPSDRSPFSANTNKDVSGAHKFKVERK